MSRGEIERTDDGYAARFERVLDHPPEKVWEALTDPEQLATWIYPDQMNKLAEVGYGLVSAFGHEVLEEDPPRRLVHGPTQGPDGGPVPAPEAHAIVWELTETEDGGTRLVLTHRMPALTDQAPQHMAGWHVHLDVLEAILAGDEPEEHTPHTMTIEEDGGVRFEEDGQGAWARFPELRKMYTERYARGPPREGPDEPEGGAAG